MKRLEIVATAAAVLLSGCGSSSPAQTVSASVAPGLKLSAPPSSDDRDLSVIVDATSIPAGTTGSLFAYTNGWGAPAPTCTGVDPVATFTVSRSGPMSVRVSLPGPGVYAWVLSAPGFTTPCDGSMRTVVRAKTVLTLRKDKATTLSQVKAPVPVGSSFEYSVNAMVGNGSGGPPAPWPISVVWFGPFDGEPAALAAGCGSSAPVGVSSTVTSTKEAVDVTVVTPLKTPGVYRVVATTPATDRVQAASTPCDATSPFIEVR